MIYRKDRSSRGGGVLLAIKNGIPSCSIVSPSNLELICVNIGISKPFLLCVVYVPPNPEHFYFENIIEYLSTTLSFSIPCLICGDFDLPGISWSTLTGNSSIPNTFCEFVFKWNLTQHITDPTHVKENILDLVLTTSNILISDIDVSIFSPNPIIYSDHSKITFNLNFEGISSVSTTPRLVLIIIEQIGMAYQTTLWTLISLHASDLLTLSISGTL